MGKLNPQRIIGKVISCKRMMNSKQGNPRYRVVIETPDGLSYDLLTAADHHIGYEIGNVEYRQELHEFWVGPSGTIIQAKKTEEATCLN